MQQVGTIETQQPWTLVSGARELDQVVSRLPTWRLEALLGLDRRTPPDRQESARQSL